MFEDTLLTYEEQAQRIRLLKAEVARLRTAAQTVHDTFKRDLEQGFQTRDKQYAVAILGAALAHKGGGDDPARNAD